MIHWKHIDEFIEPNWEKVGTELPAILFWRGKKSSAVLGYIRDGELFDHKWVYVCELEQGDPLFRGQRAGKQRRGPGRVTPGVAENGDRKNF